MEFTDQVQAIAKGFPNARKEDFAGHPLANQIRKSWPDSIKALLDVDRVKKYQFDSSAGMSQWSEAPWMAVLHPAITKTAMAGFYPVYLFEPGFQTICLVMGQGAQKLTDALGTKMAFEELAKRAKLLRDHGGKWQVDFIEGPFQTFKAVPARAPSSLKKDPWSVSVAFGKRYEVSHLPTSKEMANDLVKMLDLYD